MDAKKYNAYVEQITPKHSCAMNTWKAFVCGGLICTAGQGLTDLFLYAGMDQAMASAYTTLCLIAASVILTGFNLVVPIVKWRGRGIWCRSPALPILWRPAPLSISRKVMFLASDVKYLILPGR